MAVLEAEAVQAEAQAAGPPPSSSRAPRVAANTLSNKVVEVVEVEAEAAPPVAQPQAVNSPRLAKCS
jgi:hypothetical protein